MIIMGNTAQHASQVSRMKLKDEHISHEWIDTRIFLALFTWCRWSLKAYFCMIKNFFHLEYWARDMSSSYNPHTLILFVCTCKYPTCLFY